MNKFKGEVTVNDVSYRFSQNAKYKFCELRGIEFSGIQAAIKKDEIAALRDLYLAAHLEHCRKFEKEISIKNKEDMMDMIEEMEQEELKQINDALLASFNLISKDDEKGAKGEKK
jgi:hypothetical protein